MAYIASSDVKLYGNIPSSDTTADAEIAALIGQVKAVIDEYTGRTFETSSDSEVARYFTASDDVDGRTLYLDDDLNTVASIVAGTDSIASSDYVTEPRNRKPWYALTMKEQSGEEWDNPTSDGDYENAIVVTGQWAYSSAAPADIQLAAIRLVKWHFKMARVSDDMADRPIILESGATVMPTVMPRDVREILDKYRRESMRGF